ncbi:hypothetical protein FACS189443_4700 [Planctomycetales bacterium]|nr:hypothetical protein FACS189443_4700 [Planctomycetales bacterium]
MTVEVYGYDASAGKVRWYVQDVRRVAKLRPYLNVLFRENGAGNRELEQVMEMIWTDKDFARYLTQNNFTEKPYTAAPAPVKSAIEYFTDGNAIYVLRIDKLGNTDYRTDPDNSKHYKGRVWVAKITPDEKGLEKDIATLYAAGYTQDRATIALVAGKLKVFVNEKTARNDYGQTGYIYTLNKNTLAVEDQTTLFTNSNMGWHPYFNSDGTLFHFAYAGYYQYRNTTQLESMIPATAMLIAQNKKLIAGGKAGDLKTAMSYDDFNKTIADALLSKVNGRREETTNTNTTQTAQNNVANNSVAQENKTGYKPNSYYLNLSFDELRAGAEQGDARSQSILGSYYLRGNSVKGVPRDTAEAVKWLREAANQGYEPAKNILAEIGNATGTSTAQTAQNNTQNNAVNSV